MMWELVVNLLILIMLFVILYYDFKNRKITNLRFKEIEKKHEKLESKFVLEQRNGIANNMKIWKGLDLLDRDVQRIINKIMK